MKSPSPNKSSTSPNSVHKLWKDDRFGFWLVSIITFTILILKLFEVQITTYSPWTGNRFCIWARTPTDMIQGIKGYKNPSCL